MAQGGGGWNAAGRAAPGAGAPRPVSNIGRTAPEASYDDDFDWERVAVFGAGIALGALLGAGVTFFTAPVSGPETRRAVRRGARRALWKGQDAWEDLRDELAMATRRKQKALRRRRRRYEEP